MKGSSATRRYDALRIVIWLGLGGVLLAALLYAWLGASPRVNAPGPASATAVAQGPGAGNVAGRQLPEGLALVAVQISPFGDIRRATIAQGDTLLYGSQGHLLMPGVLLAEVHDDRVLLHHGGSQTTLFLRTSESSAPAAAAAASAAAPPSVAQDEATANWGRLQSHGSGVLVQAAPTAGMGQALDLQDGDRIVRINGIAVTRTEEVMAMAGSAAQGGMIRVDALRDGKRIRLYHAAAPQQSPDNAISAATEGRSSD